jgi:Ca2+-binding RTX toxin-like protein
MALTNSDVLTSLSSYSEVKKIFNLADGSYFAVGSGLGYLSGSFLSSNDIIISKFDSNGTLDLTWGKGGSFLSNGVNFQGQGQSYQWNNDGISFFNHGFSSDNAGYTNHSTNPATVVYVGDGDMVLDVVINSEENLFILDRFGAAQNKFSILSVNKNGDANLNFSDDGWLDIGPQYVNTNSYISGSLSLSASGALVVQIGNEKQVLLDETGRDITPTYTLTSSAPNVSEGSTATFTLNTTNVASGTSVPYLISGITAADLVGGTTSGSVIVDIAGQATINVSLKADELTEGNETLTLTAQGNSVSTVVIDSSTTLQPYSLTSSVGTVEEGDSVVFTLDATNLVTGITLNYQISGVSAGDIVGGGTNGSIVVDSDGLSQITIALNDDGITEANEILTLTVNGLTASVTVKDSADMSDDSSVVFNPANGHYYQAVSDNVTWTQALEYAGQQYYQGLKGYLVTITSSEENEFVHKSVVNASDITGWGSDSGYQGIWLGASDSGTEGVWKWMAGPETNTVFARSSGPQNIQTEVDKFSDFHAPVYDGSNPSYDYVVSQVHTTEDVIFWDDVPENIGATGVWGPQLYGAGAGYVIEFGGLTSVMESDIDPLSQFIVSTEDSIEDLESLTAGTGPLNTLVLPDDAGDVYFVFDEDGTGLLLPTDTTVWTELAEAGSVTFKAGFNGIVAGSGDDSLFGSDANSEVFAPGSFNEVGNIVYGGDDDENETVDYVDYRAENEFATQSVELVSEIGVSEEREFNGVVLALEDNNGEDGFATVQRSLDAFDEISSIEGVLGSLKNDLLDASQIGASGAVLAGFEGDDLLIGSDAKDVLVGGSGNDILVAGNELSGVNLLEGGLGKDTVVASGAKDLIFVRMGDDLGTGAVSGSTSTAQEQVVDFQLSGDSAKFVGRDNLVKDEFLFVSDSTSLVTADFNNVTNSLSITSNSGSYSVTVDIKTESGTSTTSYYDAITQRYVDYKVSAFVVQGQPIINNAPDLSAELLAGSAYSSVLAGTAESVTRVALLRQRMGELIDTAGVADAVVGGRDDDIIVLSGKGSEIKGDIAIGGQGSDLYEVRMVSDLRNANDPPIPTTEVDKITIREMGARGGSNNHDGIFIEGVKDIWSDITLARSNDGKSLEIDYKQFTFNANTTPTESDDYIQQSQGELNVYKQYDYKAPYYRVEKLALQDADDGTTTIFNLGMNAKAGAADSTAGFKEKISAVEFDTSVSTDLEFDGENHWLVGSGKDIYDLSGLENDAVVMLTGYDSADKLQLSDEYVYEYFDYEAEGDLEALFVQAGIGGDNVLDTGRDGVLVVAQQDSTTGSPIDHWMILMSDSSIAAADFTTTRTPELV